MITEAPIAFFISFFLGAATAWWAIRFVYKERFELLTEKVADLQERLGYSPRDKTTYSKLTNRELKEIAAELVQKLREFKERTHAEQLECIIANEPGPQVTVEEQGELYGKRSDAMLQLIGRHQQEYAQQFKTDTILLRDELLRRLPRQEGRRGNVNEITHNTAADVLEQLSELLPKRSS